MGIMIEVSDSQGVLRIDRAELIRWTKGVLQSEGVEHATISIAVLDDRSMRMLNRKHLQHDWETDVLSFQLSQPGDSHLVAEIVISAEMARNTARQAGVSIRAELALYVVHGLLHVCGYDDRNEEQAAQMRRRESEILADFGLENPFAAVTGIGTSAPEAPRCSG